MQKILSVIVTPLIFLLFLLTYVHSISAINQDLGRHILLGKIILQTSTIPKTNLFSYTYPAFPFINHHWGSEILFYLLYTASGFGATLLATTASVISGLILLFWYARKKADIVSLAIVSLLSVGILFERTDVRPEMFSLLFFAIFLVLLFKNREKPTRWIYLLIPLQLLWTNMHIYFPIGYLTVGLFFLDEIVTKYVVTNKMKHSQHLIKQHLPLFLTTLGCFLVTILNPNGIPGAFYPFHVFDNYGYTIQENQNIFFLWNYSYNQTILFFGITALLLIGVLCIQWNKTRLIDWLLTIVFGILAMQAIRNFPLFVFAIFIPFSLHLCATISPLLKKQKVVWTILICLLIFFWYQVSYIQSRKPFSLSTPKGAANAADFVIKNHIRGPFFNNFDIGSYFLFRLYPKEKVFVDGRPESYPASFFQNVYIPMQQDPVLFEKVANQYHFNAIFFSHTDQTPWAMQFLHDIVTNKNWRLVYLDDTAVIFVKNTPHNVYLKSFDVTAYQPASDTIQGLYQLLIYFQTIQNPQKMADTARVILTKDPNNCIALSILANIDNTPVSFYATQYQLHCQ